MDAPTGPGPFPLATYPAHLGLGASCLPQPEFTGGMDWYMSYGNRHGSDGAEGRLLTMHTFDEPWPTWEMHPEGSEVVIVTTGRMTLHQELDGVSSTLVIGPGEYAINAPGVWHTADVTEPTTAVFITCGLGTEIRPR